MGSTGFSPACADARRGVRFMEKLFTLAERTLLFLGKPSEHAEPLADAATERYKTGYLRMAVTIADFLIWAVGPEPGDAGGLAEDLRRGQRTSRDREQGWRHHLDPCSDLLGQLVDVDGHEAHSLDQFASQPCDRASGPGDTDRDGPER